jgi:flavin reductase (DIM6/NTAB) family NADH-FMN oxidoreductase RutF
MELRFAGEPVSHGDHDVVICEVTDWHTPAAAAGAPPPQPLYTGRLRELGLM